MRTAAAYIRIVGCAYGIQGIVFIASAGLNALQKPLLASGLSFCQMFVLYVPLAYVLSKWQGLSGIFIALSLSYTLAGAAAALLYRREIQKLLIASQPEAD